MTLARTHTTEPFDGGEGGSYRTWWVADGPRMVALTVMHLPGPLPSIMSGIPTQTVNTDHGSLVFEAVYTHEPQHGNACKFHDNCEPTALSNHIGVPAWQRIVAADWSDDAVYAELERLHGEIFAEVSR